MKITHHLQYIETRSKSRRDVVYCKYQAVIPEDVVEKAGWHVGDELEFTLDRQRRIVIAARPPTPLKKSVRPEADYETIRLAIWSILHTNANGLNWTQIHAKASALPKKPSPFLVAKLITDIGLRRDRDAKTSRRVWRVG